LRIECEAKIAAHRTYVTERGVDPPEIADWQWRDISP
jgi:phosphoketolase